MKRIVAILALAAVLGGLAPAQAQAGAATSVALGLASFAVFNQLAFGLFAPPVWANTYYAGYYYPPYYAPAVYAPPPVVYYPPAYYPPPVAYASPPAPRVQNEVVYPHGRYVLRGDGVTAAYQWVWIPNPPAAPSPPAPTR